MSISILQISNPGPGQNIVGVVPANTYYVLRALRVLFTSDANVATRFVTLSLDNGTNSFFTTQQDVGQAASLAISYNFSIGASGPAAPGATTTPRLASIPKLILPPAYRILVQAASIQAGDAFTNCFLYLETAAGEYFTKDGQLLRLNNE